MGGIERVVKELSEGLNKRGFSSFSIATTKNIKTEFERINDVDIQRYPSTFQIGRTPFSLKLFFGGGREIKKANAVYLHYPFPFGDLVTLFWQSSCIILFYHSDIVRQSIFLKILYAPLQYLTLRSAKVIIATSPNYVATSRILKRFKEKVQVIPIGTHDHAVREFKKPEFLFDFSEPYCLFVGALRYYKGIDTLIEAAESFEGNILIIGGGENKLYFENKVIELNLKNIFFVGIISDSELNYCYKHSSFFVFPSNIRSEAFGVALVEALSFGLPLITCEIGTGTSYVNRHNQTGIVIEPNNSQQLSKSMNFLLTNKIERQRFSINSRKRYLSHFQKSKMLDDHEKLINELLKP